MQGTTFMLSSLLKNLFLLISTCFSLHSPFIGHVELVIHLLYEMDTTEYLTRQGWRGVGHALHPTGRGIKKPLLTSQKKNVLGIGKKKYDAHADQWWARAFDSSLQDLNVGKVDEGTHQSLEPVAAEGLGIGENQGGDVDVMVKRRWGQLDVLRAGGGKWVGKGGLYGGFVKGQGLIGTIEMKAVAFATKSEKPTTSKRMTDAETTGTGDQQVPALKKRKREDKDEKEEGSKRHTKRAEVDLGETEKHEKTKSSVKIVKVTKPESNAEHRERRSQGTSARVADPDTAETSIGDPITSTTVLKLSKKKRRKQDQIDVLKGVPRQMEEANSAREDHIEDRHNLTAEHFEDTAKRLRKEARRAKRAQRQASLRTPKLIDGKKLRRGIDAT